MKVILSILILFCLAATMPRCSTPQGRIAGSWQCLSRSNPDPFFAKSLEGTGCPIIVEFKKKGTFTWREGTDPVITGTWRSEGNILVMEIPGEENIPLKIRFEGKQLILDTNDGFTFVMKRK